MVAVRVVRKNKDGLFCEQYAEHTELSKQELRDAVVDLSHIVHRDRDEIAYLRKLLLATQGHKNEKY